MQSTRHDANLAALQSSALPGHILDVIVLTSDGGLLATLRDASGPEHGIWHAPTADAAVDLLIGGRCGVLIADLGTVRSDAAALLSRLHSQFPELVLMATGRRDEESAVAALVSDGRIYRFLHKPISPARGNLFLSAASRRYFELRNTQPMMMSTVRTIARRPHSRKWAIAAGIAILVAILGFVAWFALRDGTQPPSNAMSERARSEEIANLLGAAQIAEASDRTIEPRGNNALDHYLTVLRLDPENALAQTKVAAIVVNLEEQISSSLKARTPAQGASALAALRRAKPDHPRIAQLQDELIKLSRSMNPGAPAIVAPARTAPRALPPAPAPAPEVSEPANVSAGEAESLEALGTQPQERLPEPDAPSDASPEQDDAQARADADAREQLGLASRLRERGMLLAPEDNNAFDYLRALAAQHPDLEGLSAERQRLAFSLLEHARTALAAKQLDVARSHLQAAEDLLPGMAAAQALREQLRAAQEEHDFWNTIAEAGTLKALRPLQAEYPREARLRGTEGWVDVEFTIRDDGTTEDLIVRAAEPQGLFDQSAVDAIRRSRFEPFTKSGVPVKQRALLRVKYELSR